MGSSTNLKERHQQKKYKKLKRRKIVRYIVFGFLAFGLNYYPFNRVAIILHNIIILLFVGMILYDVTNLLAKNLENRTSSSNKQNSIKRIYIARTIVFTIALVSVASIQFGYFQATQSLSIKGCQYYTPDNTLIYSSYFSGVCSEVVKEIDEESDGYIFTYTVTEEKEIDDNKLVRAYTIITIERSKYYDINFTHTLQTITTITEDDDGNKEGLVTFTSKITDFRDVENQGYIFKTAEYSNSFDVSEALNPVHTFNDEDYEVISYDYLQEPSEDDNFDNFVLYKNYVEDGVAKTIGLGNIKKNSSQVYTYYKSTANDTSHDSEIRYNSNTSSIFEEIVYTSNSDSTLVKSVWNNYSYGNGGLFSMIMGGGNLSHKQTTYLDETNTSYLIENRSFIQTTHQTTIYYVELNESTPISYYRHNQTSCEHYKEELDFYNASVWEYIWFGVEQNNDIYYNPTETEATDLYTFFEYQFANFSPVPPSNINFTKPVYID